MILAAKLFDSDTLIHILVTYLYQEKRIRCKEFWISCLMQLLQTWEITVSPLFITFGQFMDQDFTYVIRGLISGVPWNIGIFCWDQCFTQANIQKSFSLVVGRKLNLHRCSETVQDVFWAAYVHSQVRSC